MTIISVLLDVIITMLAIKIVYDFSIYSYSLVCIYKYEFQSIPISLN